MYLSDLRRDTFMFNTLKLPCSSVMICNLRIIFLKHTTSAHAVQASIVSIVHLRSHCGEKSSLRSSLAVYQEIQDASDYSGTIESITFASQTAPDGTVWPCGGCWAQLSVSSSTGPYRRHFSPGRPLTMSCSQSLPEPENTERLRRGFFLWATIDP